MPLNYAKSLLSKSNPSLDSLVDAIIYLAKDFGYAQTNETIDMNYFLEADRVLNQLKQKIINYSFH